jgi:hypothetical protein
MTLAQPWLVREAPPSVCGVRQKRIAGRSASVPLNLVVDQVEEQLPFMAQFIDWLYLF